MSKMSAAQESASITGKLLLFIVKLYTCSLFRNYFVFGYHERTVRAYAEEFFENDMKFNNAQQSKYERQCVLSDEELRSQASLWVRENAFKKGEPNMTSAFFAIISTTISFQTTTFFLIFHAQSLFVLLFAGFTNLAKFVQTVQS